MGENIYSRRTAIRQERKICWEDKVRKGRFYYLEVVLGGKGGIAPMLKEHLGNVYKITSIFRPSAPLACTALS